MKRFSIRNLFLVSVLILSLLSGCVIKTSQVTIIFGSERLSEAEHAYIRYSNSDVVQAPNLLPKQNSVTVDTNSTQSIVGGYVSDGVVSWVPNMGYGLGQVTVSNISASKPTLPVSYVELKEMVLSQPGYINVTFAVYDTNGEFVDDRTEIFAHSADTALTFYNIDPNDQGNGSMYTRTNTVDEGYSWYTVNGFVTFQIKSGISEIYNVPLSLYSGSQFITNEPFNKKFTPVAATNVGSAGDASSLLIGDTLAMRADILPVDASYKMVKWSVENGTGSATISTSGVLTGISAGTVTVKATANDGSNVYGTKTIKIHEPVIPVQNISVTAEDEVSTIESGKTLQMYAVVAPSDATYRQVTWSVIDGTGTAVIDEETGELTAGNPGTVTVQATASDESEVVGSTIVTITAAQVPVSSITLTGDSSLLVGQTLTVDATVAPANATDKSIEWSVENETGTATISTNGVLTGTSAGTVTVIAAAIDGSTVYGTKTIEIKEPTIPVQTISVSADGEVDTIESGKKLQMNAVAAPSNATNKAVAWSVIDGTGTAVIDKTTGELTVGNPGTVTVQATATDESGVVGSTILTITAVQVPVASIALTGDSSVLVGQTLTVDATVAPANATDKSIEWSVENGTGTATISKSGVLTGVSAGTVTVKATAADGSAVYGTKAVEVKVSSGGGGDHSNPTPTPAPTTKPEKTPEPKPTAPPEVRFDQNVIQVEKVISSLNKKVEEAKANPTDVEFKDTKSHWAGATVHIFVKLGIVNGYEDGSFHPNASITRAEFATIIAKVFDLSATGDKNKLSDVSDHWASASIAALIESGIISGYEDGTFKPNKEISRAEIISIISKIIDLKAVNTASAPAFTDIDEAWNKEQIKQAAVAGIINGAGNGQFAPNKPSSRAEALTIILHTLQTNADLKAILEALK
ncbi:Ig-like domain-containing protein [Paenibacillus sp. NRS-1760]|uniref:Ig-like domain-containing protein n=1 Tax=Paenibacillus sp. NRS-1760 TaxID=3233902 RepID=UPI003D27B817